jgi:hypothetical protein
VDVAVVIRQVVFASPPSDLLRFPIRASIAILLAPIPLVQEALVVALELVVQDDAVYSPAVVANALLGVDVGSVDVRVVSQFARLPETCVERLPRLPGAFLVAPIRFEQVSATLGKDDGAVVRAEWTRTQQTLLFEVALGSEGVVAAVMEIALGHDAKGTNVGEYPALGVVDLVHAIAFSHRAALTSARQVEILREHVARITVGWLVAFAAPAAAAATPIADVASIAVIG